MTGVANANGKSNVERVYERLVAATSHDRTRSSLAVIWKALHKMRDDGVSDYSVARVGVYSEALGGPRTQSIRNKNGAHFRELIAAFAATDGKPGKKLPARPESNIDAAIRAIPDQGVRLAIQMKLEQGRRDRSDLDMLRSAFKKLSVSMSGLAVADGASEDLTNSARPRAELSAPLTAAIEKFLSTDWLEERLWKVDPDGSIVDESIGDALVAPPGFADALREILRLQAPDEV